MSKGSAPLVENCKSSLPETSVSFLINKEERDVSEWGMEVRKV